MANAVVTSVIDKLVSMLLDKAFQEAARLIDFNQKLSGLVDKLRPFKALLKDAYQKSKRDELIQEWLLDLQDVVYDAEDLFEDFQSSLPLDIADAAAASASDAAAAASAGSAHPRPGLSSWIFPWVSPAAASAAATASGLSFRHRMGKRVDELMNRIAEIERRSQAYQLAVIAYSEPAFNRSAEPTLPRRVFLREESETVGIDDSIRTITSWLSDEGSSHFQTRRRIAVVGMGGMGKTHLLTHLFKTKRGDFEKSAWLTISQSFNSKALREMLGKEISLSVEGLTVEAARERIFESLRGRRSLLMLDDVWHSGRRLLDDLGVPDEDGCKVIISTRKRDVADDMRAEICEMPRLSEENSWILFCRHAFSSGVAPKELEAVAQEMAKKCRRLPLAIKTVAASMYTRRLPNEWSDALDRLSKVDLSSQVIPVLEMSYEALPSHLKLCFIFCSAFREDYKINCNFLKALWIGEGIVCGGETTTPSDVAEGYLNDLINLCLLEATYCTAGNRASDFCKMHDLLREMALDKSQNEMRCFFQAGKEINERSLQQLSGRRRASLMACDFQIPLRNIAGLESLRTLLLAENRHLEAIDADFLPNLRHLRVLDLSHTTISVLPQSIGSLKHLRVLDLSRSNIEELPETVSQLRHLQHLNVSWSRLKKLPMEIGQLKCLTYLDLNGFSIELMPAKSGLFAHIFGDSQTTLDV